MTTGIWYKVAGAWSEVDQPYLKVNNVWQPVLEVDFKSAGSWVDIFSFDTTPPDVPDVSLELITTYNGQGVPVGSHIQIGVRLPGGTPLADLQMIRVLTTYNNAAPTTQYGGTYTVKPDDDWPNEPWSDWSYNGFNSSKTSKDSSQYVYKTWPRGATDSSDLKPDTTYYFTAWAVDFAGNWSAANAASIHVPKSGVDPTATLVKEARFQPTSTGSVTDVYVSGDLVQQGTPNPTSRGFWFYNQQITNNVASDGSATVKSAQIRVSRRADNGQPSANVYLFWHTYANAAALPTDKSTIVYHGTALIGTVAQGESKWLDVPEAMYSHIEDNSVLGFGLYSQDPAVVRPTASDYSVVKSVADDIRTGEFHVVWTETLGEA